MKKVSKKEGAPAIRVGEHWGPHNLAAAKGGLFCREGRDLDCTANGFFSAITDPFK